MGHLEQEGHPGGLEVIRILGEIKGVSKEVSSSIETI